MDVVDEANDNAMLAPMMERAEETTGTKAQTTLADAGYFAGSHLEECASRGQQVVVSESRRRFLKDPYHKDQFTYDEQSDSFTCPQGQTLHFVRIQHANGVPLRLYRASGAVCQACPAFGVCTRAKEIGRSLIPSQKGLFEMNPGVRRGLEGRRPRDAGCWPHRTICRAQDKRDPVAVPLPWLRAPRWKLWSGALMRPRPQVPSRPPAEPCSPSPPGVHGPSA